MCNLIVSLIFVCLDEEEVEYLKSITQEDLCRFFDDYIAGAGPKRRKLSVHVIPVENKNGPSGANPLITLNEDVTETNDTTDITDTTDGQLEETDSGVASVEVRMNL